MPPSCLTRSPPAAAEPPGKKRKSVSEIACYPGRRTRETINLVTLGFQGLRTSSDDIVHDQDLLPRLDRALLHLEVIRAVLLHVLSRDAGAGQLALLPDGHEAGVEPQGQRGPEQEAPGVQANDDIRLDGVAGAAEVQELQLEGAEEGVVDGRVEEPWHDIQEVDTGDGEVGEAAEGLLEAYLCTGEFGGGGGGGGGLSSRGIVGSVDGGGFWVGGQVTSGFRGGCHVEGREKGRERGRKWERSGQEAVVIKEEIVGAASG